MNIEDLDPPKEVEHLRRLLDIQPSCLMRIAADGLVLAANEAALKLLGIESLGQALGMDFSAWILPEQRDSWLEFNARVIQGAAASVECDIVTPLGERRTTLLHAVPLNPHPDGIPSMAVAARGVTDWRQLEAALEARGVPLRQVEEERLEAQKLLEEAETDRQQLESMVHALEAQRNQLETDLEAERFGTRRLTETVQHLEIEAQPRVDPDRVRQLEMALETNETALNLTTAARAAAETQRDQALADRHQCEVALEELEGRYQRLTAERTAERERVLQMLESLAVQHEQDLRNAQDSPERARLAAELEARDAALRQAEAAREAAQDEAGQALAERLRLESEARENEAQYERRAAIDSAECARLQQAIDFLTERHNAERQAQDRDARERLAELQQARAEAAQKCDEIQARADQALADCRRIEDTLQLREAALKALADEHAATATERDRLGRMASEQAVQLSALAAHGRRLMLLASAGRVARDIASQLQQHVERVDQISTGVLIGGALDRSVLPELELLRSEAIQASALTAELLMAGLDQPATDQTDAPSDADSWRHS